MQSEGPNAGSTCQAEPEGPGKMGLRMDRGLHTSRDDKGLSIVVFACMVGLVYDTLTRG